MDNHANEFWNKVSPALRQHLDLAPPTWAEAEAQLRAASSAPLPEQRLKDILAFALSGKKAKRKLADLLPDWLKSIDLNEVSQDMVFSLARNAGVADDEVKQVLDQLRREALEDEVDNGEHETGI